MRLATKPARSRSAADVAATPYAIAVSMLLDQIDDNRVALLIALRKSASSSPATSWPKSTPPNSAPLAGIRELDASEWGTRLRDMRSAIVALVEAELSRFPDEVGHVLKLRDLRGSGLLSGLIWKGRDAISDGAFFCKRLIGQA